MLATERDTQEATYCPFVDEIVAQHLPPLSLHVGKRARVSPLTRAMVRLGGITGTLDQMDPKDNLVLTAITSGFVASELMTIPDIGLSTDESIRKRFANAMSRLWQRLPDQYLACFPPEQTIKVDKPLAGRLNETYVQPLVEQYQVLTQRHLPKSCYMLVRTTLRNVPKWQLDPRLQAIDQAKSKQDIAPVPRMETGDWMLANTLQTRTLTSWG